MNNNTFTLPTASSTVFYQCLTCNKKYKRKTAYHRHQQVVASYNTIPSDCYVLSVNATSEFKKTIVFMIKEQLKLHFRSTGKQSITFPCSKSQFFAVFRGHVHHFNLKRQVYKCVFHGETAYDTLAQLFDDKFWGTKFFDHDQRAFVLTYESKEIDVFFSLEDPDPLDIQDNISQKKQKKLVQVVALWKAKQKSDAHNISYSSGFISLSFTINRAWIV